MLKKTLFISATILLIAVGAYSLFTSGNEDNTLRVKRASASPAVKNINTTKLNERLDTIVGEYANLDIGVAVIDLKTGQTYRYGDESAYYGASTTKVLVASLYFHEVESGKRSITTRIEGSSSATLIKAMLEQSDNDAWYKLKLLLGNSTLEAYAKSIGMTSYVAKDNLISVADMALLLQKLANQKLLNEDHTNTILGHMKKSIRNYFSPHISKTYAVYHKAGWLDDRLMDASIIEGNGKKVVLVIFSKTYSGDYDFTTDGMVIGEIAKTVLANIKN